MSVLVLGGTREALRLTRSLVDSGVETVYSIAGRVDDHPELPCAVRRGGFGGPDGLSRYLRETGVRLLIDATHPFAAGMRQNARAAADAAAVPLIRLARPAWSPQSGDRWQSFATLATLRTAVDAYRRPFITLGQSAADWRPTPGQRFTLRAINRPGTEPTATTVASATESIVHDAAWILARGPFAIDDERRALAGHDALVCKHSGGHRPAKLDVARELGIPVLMLMPPIDEPDGAYTTVESALAAAHDLFRQADALARRAKHTVGTEHRKPKTENPAP